MTDCQRCGGLMIPELFRDGVCVSIGRRCLICGELIDPVILRNRANPPVPTEPDEFSSWLPPDRDDEQSVAACLSW